MDQRDELDIKDSNQLNPVTPPTDIHIDRPSGINVEPPDDIIIDSPSGINVEPPDDIIIDRP